MRLSNHFKLYEFEVSRIATINEIDNTIPPNLIPKITDLCINVLDLARERFGPISVHSGYRSHELNIKVGGSDRSQHSLGEAADIVSATPTREMCEWIRDSNIPFDQLIYEGSWVHISYGSRMRRSVLTAHFKNGQKTTYTAGISVS